MPSNKQNINLTEISFPLLSGLKGTGVYIKGLDKEIEPPLAYWLENTMPVKNGLASARYEEVIPASAMPALEPNFERTNVHLAYNLQGEVTYLLECVNKLYLYRQRDGIWQEIESVSDATLEFSVFFLKGTTYYFHRDIGVKRFGASFNVIETVNIAALLDFDPGAGGNVRSMTSVLSYIVGITEGEVYWSDPIDETQFDPTPPTSLAGSSKVLALKGKAKLILPITDGFIIYTNSNAVAATYTRNPNNPFAFTEVPNSSGVFNQFHVTYKNSIPVHYVWGDTGLLQLTSQSAIPVFPEVTDFLASDTMERYNPVTDEIDVTFGTPLKSKITYINSRFLAISYGEESGIYEVILIFDSTLQRWGKLNVRHKAIFNFVPPDLSGGVIFLDLLTTPFTDLTAVRFTDMVPRLSEASYTAGSFAILAEDNSVQKVEWLDNVSRGQGRVIFGNIALTRNRITELNELELTGIFDSASLKLEIRSLVYNPNWKVTIYVPAFNWFVGSSSGKVHEIKISGGFLLSSVVNKLAHNGME